MKKILCLLLALASLLVFTACSDGDVPDGYKLASNSEACKYSLYVPESWIFGENKTGVTMATVAKGDECSVSLSLVSDVEAGESFEAFWAAQENEYKTLFHEGFSVEEKGALVKVGGENGFRCVFTATFGGKQYKFMQVFVPRVAFFTSELYAFTYTASTDKVEGKDATHYDEHLETVNEILSFVQWN